MIQLLFLSGRLMQKPARLCGIQIMNVLLMTVSPVESSLRLPVERTEYSRCLCCRRCVQSTIACGKNSLADYIYVTVAKTSDNASGVLVCLRKSDGSKAWEDSSSYAWSSPVCVYNKDGSGKVLYCNSTGDIRLLDGKTGKQEDVLSVSEGVIEASPAVYDNYAVVGTRDCKIWGIRLQ